MTLFGTILKKVKSKESLHKYKYSSPPPEIEEIELELKKKKKPIVDKFAHVHGKVDTKPPLLDTYSFGRRLPTWKRRVLTIYAENIQLVTYIKRAHFSRGRVDCRWAVEPGRCLRYYQERADFYKKVQKENKALYNRIITTNCRIEPTSDLKRQWNHNRSQIIARAQFKFVLFPPIPAQLMEDAAFAAPPGVQRPRAYITLRIRNCAEMGTFAAELFTDVCPNTCHLFVDLLEGDGVGFGYVGTTFFRKVPGLYWSGGDVVYDNGFGCYAQRNRTVPIGAENYHFSHSMPGLLSMRVTKDDEMCGIFNITFKPLPQFDLHSVVFGRIIRPSATYTSMEHLGSALSSHPRVEIVRMRMRRRGVAVGGARVCGVSGGGASTASSPQ